MQKLGIIIGASIILTALLSTSLSFVLFQHLSEQKNTTFPQDIPVRFTKHENTNIKPLATPGDFKQTAKTATPAIVNVSGSQGGMRASNGSGVIISPDGYIITNHHVIKGTTQYSVTLNDKREYRAKLIGADPTTDLALIKIDGRNLPTLSFGDSDRVAVGEWVLAVGNPFNLTSTVTAGIISAKARNINILPGEYSIESFLQTDAVVNPGNSGGGLVNAKGDLIGINSAILTESGVFEGYSFAIPSNLVKKVVTDLREYGKVQRAILGVVINNVDDNVAAKLGLPSVQGVLIQDVRDNSSASAAGLRPNDVILSVDGFEINSMAELQERVARRRPGDKIVLEYIRNGKRITQENVRLKALKD